MDGDIDINVKAHTNEAQYTRDLNRLRAKIVGLKTSIKLAFSNLPNTILFGLVKVGDKIRNIFDGVLDGVKRIGKGLLKGGLLLFALSLVKIFTSIRESMSELIAIRGGSLAKNVEDVKNKFTELRAAVANAFLPLLEIALPYIKIVLDWLLQLFNRIAMITAAFAGQKEALQVTAGSAARLAAEAKKTEKAARGALAAFDQINVLQKPETAAEETAPRTIEAEMVPITDDILDKVKRIKDEIAAWWADPIGKLQETWGKIKDWFAENVIAPIKERWDAFWAGIDAENPIVKGILGFYNAVQGVINTFYSVVQGIFNFVFETGTKVLNFILETGQGVVNAIGENLNAFGSLVISVWEIVYTKAVEARNKITEAWQGIAAWLATNVIQPIREGFGTALEWVKATFTTVFGGIKTFVKGVINGIIDYINGMVQAITGAINLIVTGFNSVGSIVPGFVPMSYVEAPRIPKLASGAVIPPNAEFAAILGDNKKESEILAPESTIRRIIQEELSNAGGSDVTVPIVLTLDGETIYRNQQKVSRRRGTSLIAGGVTG
jgi:phage-related protein